MTGDPRTLITEALAAHRADVQHGLTDPADAADDILGVLAAAGYRLIIPTRTILGVQIAEEPASEVTPTSITDILGQPSAEARAEYAETLAAVGRASGVAPDTQGNRLRGA